MELVKTGDEEVQAERFILKPTSGRITVKVKNVEKETKSGILLVGTSHSEKPTTGVVEEVCDEYELEGEDYDPLFKKGELVVFGKFSGTKVEIGRDTYFILRESDILGRLIPSNAANAAPQEKVKVNAPAPE